MAADKSENQVAAAAAACLGHGQGPALMAYLQQTTIMRELPPDASDAELRDLEGQRRLFRRIARLVQAGMEGSPGSFIADTQET
ncbi:hypothetical protein [Ferrovibrio terrae]|uniref:Bbp19 family protein n=1 Tax=Ferrovibrio terrae TaxID=2594003 RepID=UPI003137EBF5